MDEIAEHLAALISGDGRLDDNLSEMPTVYSSSPGIEDSTPPTRVYVDWMDGFTERYEPQVKSGMTLLQLVHRISIWWVVYNDVPATADENFARLLDNLVLILCDSVDESGYWVNGLIESWNPRTDHPNLIETAGIRYHVGKILFRIIQEKIV